MDLFLRTVLDIELVLEGDGNTLKWTDQFATISQMLIKTLYLHRSVVETFFGKAVRLVS